MEFRSIINQLWLSSKINMVNVEEMYFILFVSVLSIMALSFREPIKKKER